MSEVLLDELSSLRTRDERLEFLASNGMELDDDQLGAIAGGVERSTAEGSGPAPDCPASGSNGHVWIYTGRKKPGWIFGYAWPDVEMQCRNCGRLEWFLMYVAAGERAGRNESLPLLSLRAIQAI